MSNLPERDTCGIPALLVVPKLSFLGTRPSRAVEWAAMRAVTTGSVRGIRKRVPLPLKNRKGHASTGIAATIAHSEAGRALGGRQHYTNWALQFPAVVWLNWGRASRHSCEELVGSTTNHEGCTAPINSPGCIPLHYAISWIVLGDAERSSYAHLVDLFILRRLAWARCHVSGRQPRPSASPDHCISLRHPEIDCPDLIHDLRSSIALPLPISSILHSADHAKLAD